MFPIRDFEARFREVLEALDAACEAVEDDDRRETMEDLNAELDDALMLLTELRPGREDFSEELTDALEALEELAEDYDDLAVDGAAEAAERLRRLTALARENLP